MAGCKQSASCKERASACLDRQLDRAAGFILEYWWKINVCLFLVILGLVAGALAVTRLPGNSGVLVRVEHALSTSECSMIIESAEAYASERGGWMTKRHRNYPTMDLSVWDVVPVAAFWNETLESRVFDRLGALYGVPQEDLYLRDLFVVKYAMDGQRELPLHMDGSHISFNIALNSFGRDFEGGGTFVRGLGETVAIGRGSGLYFQSGIFHAGVAITRGVRYILVGFVKVRGARWFDAFGMFATRFTYSRAGTIESDGNAAGESLAVVDRGYASEVAFLLWHRFNTVWENQRWVVWVVVFLSAVVVVLVLSILYDYWRIAWAGWTRNRRSRDGSSKEPKRGICNELGRIAAAHQVPVKAKAS